MTHIQSLFEASADDFAKRGQYAYAALHYDMAEEVAAGFKARERLTMHAVRCRFLASKVGL